METDTFELRTGSREAVADITRQCAAFAAQHGGDGLLHVFVPHATAGIAIIETGSGSDADLLSYGEWTDAVWDYCLTARQAAYTAEPRWPGSTFWSRRRNPPQGT